ncbi:hypothetical protein P175DRAFT_0533014 [Aspergillus ochraceoroseus IBT 24754]|uniref:Uncharacterized protein n=1 Tax=Aspergillus ochraceoroseus IBT 24754 TaxID=1392256 RepID=A0A2T5LUS6_9EURO|nr:uncharacterized protein P175DRAFT_0533014 [Aspergillus ochraceoroseus IBT 24754]PTU20042.1 hypothetical protein P175DRAFT_0533014 [Aspergillus ochraceoroseus IBT 24754]
MIPACQRIHSSALKTLNYHNIGLPHPHHLHILLIPYKAVESDSDISLSDVVYSGNCRIFIKIVVCLTTHQVRHLVEGTLACCIRAQPRYTLRSLQTYTFDWSNHRLQEATAAVTIYQRDRHNLRVILSYPITLPQPQHSYPTATSSCQSFALTATVNSGWLVPGI